MVVSLSLECHRHSDVDPKKPNRKEDPRMIPLIPRMIPLIDLKTSKSDSLVIKATILVSLVVEADPEQKGVKAPFRGPEMFCHLSCTY